MIKKFHLYDWLEPLVYIFIIVYWSAQQILTNNGTYIDTDNYFHVLRTIDFMQNPSIFEHRFMWSNYPFGEISHWTKLPDILMSLLILPFLPFYPLKEAAFAGGLLFNPFLLITTFLVCWLGVKNLLNFRSRIAFFVILFAQIHFMQSFLADRPDHHSLLIFLMAGTIWQIRCFSENKREKHLLFTAMFAATSLWVSAEGIFLYLGILGSFYLGYLLQKNKLSSIVKITSYYVCFTSIYYLINPPYQGYLYFDNGRLSLLYVLIAVWVNLSFYLSNFLKSKLKQTTLLILSAILLIALTYFGGLLSSPLDKTLQTAFTSRISELNSGGNIYYLAYPLIGLICAAKLLSKQSVLFTIYLTVNLALYTCLQIYAMRFLASAALFSAFLIALKLNQTKWKNLSFLAAIFLLYNIDFISFALNTLISNKIEDIKPQTPTQINLDSNLLPSGAVVTDVFIAPYIIWYTEKPVIASPYHRNVEGILDNHQILFSSDMNKVIKLIRKHKVGSIYIPQNMDSDYYKEPEKNCDKLYGQIMKCGNYPEWLIKKNHPNSYLYVVDWQKLPK